METDKKLDMLYGLRLQKESRELEKATLIEALIPEAVRAEIAKIEEKYDDTELTDKMTRLENEIREEVLNYGASVKGRYLQATYSKGRTSWNTKALEGVLVAYPELEKFRTVGTPSISLRKIG
jgi:hypothetical protein